MKEIIKKDWDYILHEDQCGDYLLSVMCGTVGLYFVTIKLSEVESADYSRMGVSYLDKLAKRIRNSPSSFSDRAVRLPRS